MKTTTYIHIHTAKKRICVCVSKKDCKLEDLLEDVIEEGVEHFTNMFPITRRIVESVVKKDSIRFQ